MHQQFLSKVNWFYNLFESNKHITEYDNIKNNFSGNSAKYINHLKRVFDYFINKNWKKCIIHGNLLLDFAYTRINMGQWNLVLKEYRILYAYSSIFINLSKIFLHDKKNLFEFFSQILERIDLTILLGDFIIFKECDNLLSEFAQCLHDYLISLNPIKISTKIDDSEIYFSNTKIVNKNEILEILPCYYKSHLWTHINRVRIPSIVNFKLQFFDKQVSTILTESMMDWPAFNKNKWSINYFNQICGYRNVPIEIGTKYNDESWSQTMMQFYKYIQNCFESNDNKKPMGYLAQHRLLEQIPILEKDVIIPDYCFVGNNLNQVDINSWIGPKGTISPAHTDPKDNFLCQIVGEKLVYLFDTSQNDFMYPEIEGLNKNTSRVNVEYPDLEKFPNFIKAKPIITILRPGEMLYIPSKHWHYVRSLSTSISINFWYD
ncbi:Jumonji domain-containing protein 5 [Intoshia linei]|uniref:Jumonji domain-containing protein 5 n=1 Tax=Intoshia linei TaxID=1819745 RepID=A0A177B5B6_9BILA|nr:Jumonji domain-containing protein 5 [Intoshia linei]